MFHEKLILIIFDTCVIYRELFLHKQFLNNSCVTATSFSVCINCKHNRMQQNSVLRESRNGM